MQLSFTKNTSTWKEVCGVELLSHKRRALIMDVVALSQSHMTVALGQKKSCGKLLCKPVEWWFNSNSLLFVTYMLYWLWHTHPSGQTGHAACSSPLLD
jgi:hypothetical protein